MSFRRLRIDTRSGNGWRGVGSPAKNRASSLVMAQGGVSVSWRSRRGLDEGWKGICRHNSVSDRGEFIKNEEQSYRGCCKHSGLTPDRPGESTVGTAGQLVRAPPFHGALPTSIAVRQRRFLLEGCH